MPLAVGTEAARARRFSPTVVFARGGAREAADEGACAGDVAGARPREGAARLARSRAGARSSVAGHGEDEDGGASVTGRRKLGVFFGFAVGEGRFWVRDPFPVRDSNHGIGLVFAFLLLETVLALCYFGTVNLALARIKQYYYIAGCSFAEI